MDELKHLGILFEKQSGLSALDVEVMLSIFVMRQSDFFRCFCLIAFSYMISGTRPGIAYVDILLNFSRNFSGLGTDAPVCIQIGEVLTDRLRSDQVGKDGPWRIRSQATVDRSPPWLRSWNGKARTPRRLGSTDGF